MTQDVATMVPEKAVIMPGELLLVEVRVPNPHQGEIRASFEVEPPESVEVLDAEGETLCRSGPRKARAGLSPVRRVRVAPGKEATHRFALNEYCTTRLAPGEYAFRFPLEVDGDVVRCESRFQIVPEVGETLARAYESLALAVLRVEDGLELRGQVSRMLACAESPRAVAALRRVLTESDVPGFRVDAINGLTRVGSVEAVHVLVSITEGEHNTADIRARALEAIYVISEQATDGAVREACEPTVSTTTRPKRAVVRD